MHSASRHRGGARHWWRLANLTAVVVPLIVWAGLAYRHRWIADDGLINVRIVRNLLAGHGPVFNAGERVEAGTSAIWVVLLAALHVVIPIGIDTLAVWTGFVLSLVGLAAALLAANKLIRTRGQRGVLLPLGGLAIAVLPGFRDFATSGLETGLTFAWEGISILLLALIADDRSTARGVPLTAAVLFGLAPLVRPDLAIVGGAFLAGLVVLQWDRGRPRVLKLVGAAALVPVASELFRMAYFGIVVPNTALAKEASRPRLDQGFAYLSQFLRTRHAVVPVVALLAVLLAEVVARATGGGRRAVVPLVAPAAGGILHMAYIVVIGGDFMAARLLLPGVFCCAAPVALVCIPTGWWRSFATAAVAAGALVVLVWSALSISARAPAAAALGSKGIVDERAFYVLFTGHAHPMRASDYRTSESGLVAALGSRLARDGDPRVCVIIDDACAPPMPRLAADWRSTDADVLYFSKLGVMGASLPLDVYVVDGYGLSDPTVARLRLTTRGRPGHEKVLSLAYVYARFADPADPPPAIVAPTEVADARAALACPPLADVYHAVRDRLTLGRAWRNVIGAVRRTRLRFSAPPAEARRELCQGQTN